MEISKYWICLSPLNHYCIVAFTKTVSEVLFLGSRRVLVLIHVTQKIDASFKIPKILFSELAWCTVCSGVDAMKLLPIVGLLVSETEGGTAFTADFPLPEIDGVE